MDLFSPVKLGSIALENRIVMAPLTRTRAGHEGIPNDLLVEHYSQRATVGMIITEGTYPSKEGQGYPGQPGIVTDEQQAGWARVAEAVHSLGGKIVMQVMHAGRVSHTDVTETARTVAPSAVQLSGEIHTATGKAPYTVPHELSIEELAVVKQEFIDASKRAIAAGLDGVEMHSANGYLLHEFLGTTSNTRTDAYGGSPENRARFVIEVTTAVAEAIGADRVGIRLSPSHNIQDIVEDNDEDVKATYGYLADQLAPLGLAYVSFLHAEPEGDFIQDLRNRVNAPTIVNRGFSSVTSLDDATALIEGAKAEAIAVGRAIIANPDLVARWKTGAELNPLDPNTLYGSSPEGYIDYPFMEAD